MPRAATASITARDIPTERPIVVAEGDEAAGELTASGGKGTVADKEEEGFEGVVVEPIEPMAVAERLVDVKTVERPTAIVARLPPPSRMPWMPPGKK